MQPNNWSYPEYYSTIAAVVIAIDKLVRFFLCIPFLCIANISLKTHSYHFQYKGTF